MRSFAAAASLAALILAACVPAHTEADPCAAANRDINLFSLLGNTTSGVYDKCLDDLRSELARARLRARGLQAEARRLEAEAATLQGERAAAARRLAAVNVRQVATLRRVESAKTSQAVDQARLRDVLAREAALAQELEQLNLNTGIGATQADRLQRKQEGLNRRIDAMLGDG